MFGKVVQNSFKKGTALFKQTWCVFKATWNPFKIFRPITITDISQRRCNKLGLGYKWEKELAYCNFKTLQLWCLQNPWAYSIFFHENQSIKHLPTIFNLQKYYHPFSYTCAWALPQSKKDQPKGRDFRKDDFSLPV